MGKFSEKCKIYLKWANFTLGRDTPRYSKTLWTDAIVAFTYSIISIFLIWIQGTDVIVLGLNILCMIRSIISNRLNEYRIMELSDIENNFVKYSHYHLEVIITCVAAFFSIIVWSILMLEAIKVIPSSVTGMWLMRIFATIAILIVLGNDWEDIVICAFDATVRT